MKLFQQYAYLTNRKVKEIEKHFYKHLHPKLELFDTVEYIYLFSNYIGIKNSAQYLSALDFLLKKVDHRLFWYYSGHGVVRYKDRPQTGILIPHEVEKDCYLLSSEILTQKIFSLKASTSIIAILDCCHAESVFRFSISPLPPKMIVLASSRSTEKSGFYQETDVLGSLFTYFLLKYLGEPSQESIDKREDYKSEFHGRVFEREGRNRKFQELTDSLSYLINKYRQRSGKNDQNICIITTRHLIDNLPKWICHHRRYKILD